MWNSSVVKEFDGLVLVFELLHTGGSLGDAAVARHKQRVALPKGRPDQGTFSWKTRSTSHSAGASSLTNF